MMQTIFFLILYTSNGSKPTLIQCPYISLPIRMTTFSTAAQKCWSSIPVTLGVNFDEIRTVWRDDKSNRAKWKIGLIYEKFQPSEMVRIKINSSNYLESFHLGWISFNMASFYVLIHSTYITAFDLLLLKWNWREKSKKRLTKGMTKKNEKYRLTWWHHTADTQVQKKREKAREQKRTKNAFELKCW